MTMETSKRDQRIDLLRGLALLILITDHLPGNPLRQIMPVSWGLADMAEVFILFSGYVFGIGLQKQKSASQRRWRFTQRILIIYFAYVVTALLLVRLVRSIHASSVASLLPPHLLGNSLVSTAIDILTLNGRVTHLCILLLYLWLGVGMLSIPHRIWKNSRLVFIFSLLLYGLTQFFEVFALPEPLQSTTYYNPFSWQFLFISGVVFSLLPHEQRQRLFKNSRVLALSLVLQGGLLLLVGANLDLPHVLTEKRTLGLLRYLHVISGAMIGFAIMPEKFSTTTQRFLKPILVCSEQSIWVYCGGSLVVVALSDWSMQTIHVTTAVLILAWSGCVGIAMTVAWFKVLIREEKRSPSSEA